MEGKCTHEVTSQWAAALLEGLHTQTHSFHSSVPAPHAVLACSHFKSTTKSTTRIVVVVGAPTRVAVGALKPSQ